jgi:hypothetical protein
MKAQANERNPDGEAASAVASASFNDSEWRAAPTLLRDRA